MAGFPQTILGLTIEIQINGQWHDISQYVYQRDDIVITGGQAEETQSSQPGRMTLTLDNRDGRFSPNYVLGAYYPFLLRNTQIRVSINSQSSTNVTYFGYRFWGTVLKWPPLSDKTGVDAYVQIEANGPLRSVNQGGGVGSAIRRYYDSLTGQYAPIAYWPGEEDPNATSIQAGVNGGTPMTVTGTPLFKGSNAFNGSGPIGVLNKSVWDGLTGSFNSSGDDIYNVPGTYTWVSPVSSVDCRVTGPGGGGESGNVPAGRGGHGPGGGEFSREATLAVTIGKAYKFTILPGGKGGALTTGHNDGQDGGVATFPGDAVTVSAHGGFAGTATGPGAAGSGSTNTVHNNGAAGGTGAGVLFGPPRGGGGGAGGSSGGTSLPGVAGGNAPTGSQVGGTPGTPPAGAGAGGHGGRAPDDGGGTAGSSPGGAGAGGGVDATAGYGHGGFPGASSKVELIYTPATVPTNNVIRWVMMTPLHGANIGKVVMRIFTSGTIHQLDVIYNSAGNLVLKGFNNVGGLLFTSGNVTITDGVPFMASVELGPSGANMAWAISTLLPGAAALQSFQVGTQAAASIGNVTEVIAGPNADITKTAIGHISVQYALIPLLQLSDRINGHVSEMTIDRFIRLANEQAMDTEPEFNETADHWGFEGWTFSTSGTPTNTSYFILSTAQAGNMGVGDTFTTGLTGTNVFTITGFGQPFAGFVNVGFAPAASTVLTGTTVISKKPANLGTSSWVPTNCSLSQTQNFDSEPGTATHCLTLTASGAGHPIATSPTGTSGQPVSVGDIVSVAIDVMVPVGLNNLFVGIQWFQSSGAPCAHGADNSPDTVVAANTITTLKVKAFAPATAAFFCVSAGDDATDAVNTIINFDNVRVTPRMGAQTTKELKAFLAEIKALDAGIMKESRRLFGLGYRTRIAITNQAAAVTLDYAQAHISDLIAPVTDDFLLKTQVTVKRHKGSTVTVSLNQNQLNAIIPPQPPRGSGSVNFGPFRGTQNFAAEADEQLLNLANHLLNLGSVVNARYPNVPIDMARTAVANLWNALANVSIGDRITLVNLPFWHPAATVDQMVIGYTENISAFKWTINWNCRPFDPYIITASSIRRW